MWNINHVNRSGILLSRIRKRWPELGFRFKWNFTAQQSSGDCIYSLIWLYTVNDTYNDLNWFVFSGFAMSFWRFINSDSNSNSQISSYVCVLSSRGKNEKKYDKNIMMHLIVRCQEMSIVRNAQQVKMQLSHSLVGKLFVFLLVNIVLALRSHDVCCFLCVQVPHSNQCQFWRLCEISDDILEMSECLYSVSWWYQQFE